METSLTDLREQRWKAVAEVKRIEQEIARHPETIREVFSHFMRHAGCVALVTKVEFVENASGTTDSRKNPIEWSGYRFRLKGDPQTYWMRHGENWCSSVNDCGVDGDEACPDLEFNRLVEFEDETARLDWICTHADWQAVGYLLRCVQGW